MRAEMLDVLLGGRHAATISQGGPQPGLRYTPEYAADPEATPLSVGIPVAAPSHSYPLDGVLSWMSGLLTDNPVVLAAQRSRFGARSVSAFDMLATPMGLDCAGAVQFCPPEATGEALNRAGGIDWLDQAEVDALITGLSVGAVAAQPGRAAGHFSLAGAQDKTALAYSGGRWGTPWGTEPTTRIVKPAVPGFADQAVVEHVCTAAAGRLGLTVAGTGVETIAGVQCLISVRYDRVTGADGRQRRIHQEDLCQALGLPPTRKYQAQRGPSPRQVAALIRRHSTFPDRDIEAFRDALIYNWVIAGTDAHAKNYSLILDGNFVALAPLYDVASLLPYRPDRDGHPDIALAMSVGGGYTLRDADSRAAWHGAARDLGLDGEETAARAADIAARTPNAISDAIAALDLDYSISASAESLLAATEERAAGLADLGFATSPITALHGLSPSSLPRRCGRIVNSTKRPCLLKDGHRGRCRSVLPG